MKQSQLYRLAIVGVLWLSIGAGCQKEAVPKCDVACCFETPPNLDLFAARLEGVPLISVIEVGISLKSSVPDVRLVSKSDLTDTQKTISFITVCPLQKEFLKNLATQIRSDPNYRNQQYAVWGDVYENPYISTFNPYPRPYSVRIDRIEKMP